MKIACPSMTSKPSPTQIPLCSVIAAEITTLSLGKGGVDATPNRVFLSFEKTIYAKGLKLSVGIPSYSVDIFDILNCVPISFDVALAANKFTFF